MLDILYCEFIKLKRANMIFISILGALVTPIMCFVGVIRHKTDFPEKIITYADMFDQTNLYIMLLFGIVVYTVIAAYLFSREYTENTLKLVLTIPVSKLSFITGKFLALLLWIVSLTMISWVCMLLFASLSSAADFSKGMLVQSIIEYLLGAILIYFTITPFVFMAVWLKGLVGPVITATTVAMIDVSLYGDALAGLSPWSAAYLLITGKIVQTGYPAWLAASIIAATAIFGFLASTVYFMREDVQ